MKNLKEIIEFSKMNISPILIEDFDLDSIKDYILIDSRITREELYGYYDNEEFIEPSWLKEIENKKFLIINDITNINLEEQKKFMELLKYRKVGTYNLPENIVILVTCKNLKVNVILEELYSILVQV